MNELPSKEDQNVAAAGIKFGIYHGEDLQRVVIPRMMVVLAWQYEEILRLNSEIEKLKTRLDAI